MEGDGKREFSLVSHINFAFARQGSRYLRKQACDASGESREETPQFISCMGVSWVAAAGLREEWITAQDSVSTPGGPQFTFHSY